MSRLVEILIIIVKYVECKQEERERNTLFAALQRLVGETLKVTEQLPEGISALERFRKIEEEYDE